MAQKLLANLRWLNRLVAMLIGATLFACAAFVLADIILRKFGSSLGGTDEISGYVMAIVTSWGMGFALLELSHVRIDILRGARWRPRPHPVRSLLNDRHVNDNHAYRGALLAGTGTLHCEQLPRQYAVRNPALDGPTALVRRLGVVRDRRLAHPVGGIASCPARRIRSQRSGHRYL